MLPKKIIIGGIEYNVILDKTSGGGSFCLDESITVGTKYPKSVPHVFLHEVLEAIFTSRTMRLGIYTDSNDSMKFCFDHKEFEQAVRDLALALKPVLKI